MAINLEPNPAVVYFFGRLEFCLGFALVVVVGDNWFVGVLQGQDLCGGTHGSFGYSLLAFLESVTRCKVPYTLPFPDQLASGYIRQEKTQLSS